MHVLISLTPVDRQPFVAAIEWDKVWYGTERHGSRSIVDTSELCVSQILGLTVKKSPPIVGTADAARGPKSVEDNSNIGDHSRGKNGSTSCTGNGFYYSIA